MSLQSIVGDSRAPGEGFFGNIASAFETGISKIGSEILPNWVASQASRQSGDQLLDTTYQQDPNTPRMEGQQAVQTVDGEPLTGFQKVVADLKIGSIGTGGLLIMGLILVGAIIVIKKV